jgi:hypothetical protein
MFVKTAPGRREAAMPSRPVVDPAGWTAADLAKTQDWIYPLSAAEIAEIADAVSQVQARGQDLTAVRREDFVLPRFRHALADMRDELREGRGFVLLRGLPVGEWSRLQSAIAYYGIGAHLGRALSQNAQGHMLGHVKDLGGDYRTARGYLTNATMTFHADLCDYVGLLCLHPAMRGGESRIASSITLYNEMLKRRPDLAAELVHDFYYSRHGEIPPGREPWFKLAPFSIDRGYLSVRGVSSYITKAQGLPGVPPLTPRQKDAMALYQQLVDEIAYDMVFEQGDMQFLNNYVVLHTRRAFQDWPEPERKRHLYRLWLADEESRPISPAFRDLIRGIEVEGFVPSAPLDPELAGTVS